MPDEQKPSITNLVQAVEAIANTQKSDEILEAGTVKDDDGNIVKLGENVDGIEIVYSDAIELPNNLFSRVDDEGIA